MKYPWWFAMVPLRATSDGNTDVSDSTQPRSIALVHSPAGASADDLRDCVVAAGLKCCETFASAQDLVARLGQVGDRCACVVCVMESAQDDQSTKSILIELRRFKAVFSIVVGPAAQNVVQRLSLFRSGARMVTDCPAAVGQALGQVASGLRSGGTYACPTCQLQGLTEEALRTHSELYHTTEPNSRARCPICGAGGDCGPLPVHLKNEHGDPATREPLAPGYPAFSWCVCQRPSDGKFLLVNEPAGISRGKPGYWLPAGRVDPGEGLREAACRECEEEAGIPARATGVIRFMADNDTAPEVLRVVIKAEPADGVGGQPKSIPDFESCGALWVDAGDLAQLSEADYRSPDPAELYPAVASGTLVSHSMETAAFEALELLVRRKLTLTPSSDRVSEAALEELRVVWKGLRETYPDSAFRISK